MHLLRAAVKVNPNSMIETMAVARLNSTAILSSGPLELAAKDFWVRVMSTMPFASKGAPFGEMIHSFFNNIIAHDLLNYAITPPGTVNVELSTYIGECQPNVTFSFFAQCAKW